MPFDVQWFIFALVSNGVMTRAEAEALYANLGDDAGLEPFAQSVLDRMVAGLSQEDAQATLEQLQTIIDYATEQGAPGIPPEFPEEAPAAPAADDADRFISADDAGSAPRSGGRIGIRKDRDLHFDAVNIDLSSLQSYADLPTLRDVSQLSDAEVAERMIALLAGLRVLGCSDLHISAMSPPFVRHDLQIEPIDDQPLSPDDAMRLNLALLSPERQQLFLKELDINFALEVGTDRFRVCLMMQKDGVEGSYRLVPDHICTLEELGFMDHDVIHIKRLLDYNNGLVLVTGPIGSGKTTTLGAMVDIINEKRRDHIITVEDPIEILQLSKNCQVTQREVGKHTISYNNALKAALREDPDVIVVGEMHDLETIENAITAAETGHLVIGTLHTGNAANTMNRILDVFPPSQQPQIRAMTAGSLRGVICQRLIPAAGGGLTNAYEILINTMAVGNTINEGKTFRLKSTMATSNKQGMCTFDQCLLEKYMRNIITYEVARDNMTDSTLMEQLKREWGTREARKLKEARGGKK
ncbi:MAG: PilT/PilU family type 4a pilus ATPase [Victivallaceae bacterium]|nr:PilT/PilU family type 4a pilus ATPase [Victivallaceae bacterium]